MIDRAFDLAVAVFAVIGVASCFTTLVFIVAAAITSKKEPSHDDLQRR